MNCVSGGEKSCAFSIKGIGRPGVLIVVRVLAIEYLEEQWITNVQFVRADADNRTFTSLQIRLVRPSP